MAWFAMASGDDHVGLRRPLNHLENPMIKKFTLILSLTFATATMAADMTCSAGAMEKKLAGAAKNSFTKKCVKDTIG
jgi:hypothetical protein